MRRSVSAAVGMVLAATLASVPGASPTGGPAAIPPVPSVPGQPLQPVRDPERKAVPVALPASAFPLAGVSTVDLRHDGGRAGELPISVRPATDGPGAVRVEVFDSGTTRRLGVAGVLLGVSRADDESAAAPVRVAIDYSGFRAAFGGGFEDRLRLLRFPACAVTTPEVASCVTGAAVAGVNDPVKDSFTAEVEAAGIAQDTTATAGIAPRPVAGFVYALAAGPSGGTGDYTATPLSSAAEWSGGGSSGQFTWSYPMRMPPAPAGAAPALGLSYSSSTVDGATAAENNQSGPAGMGFDLGTSYIERRYAACAYNGHAGGDLCWKYDNASLVLNGVSTELVRESDGVWHARKDSGWRIERVRGGDLPGRDNDDERWMVTTQDGTRYHFGLSRQPSTLKPTHSTWTVPVFGLKAGDPCWSGTWATSSCEQAWRWNLDWVQDRNGNSTTYFYEEEGNYYGRNSDVYDQAYYIRGGNLIKIEYGTREYQENTGPSAWVNLAHKFRCAGGADECGAPTKENAAKFPDTPLDMLCTNTQPCQNHSPTFFSTKRLNGVATYVHNPADTADQAQNVDFYDLDFAFYGPNDGTVDPILYLTNVKRSGGVGGTVTLEPGTWFDYSSQQHRVDVDTANGSPTLIRHHLANIYDDFGSRIDVTYGQPHPCNAAALPAEHANGTDCFRAWYKPEGKPAKFGWFRKFLVTKVSEVDRTGLSPARNTLYTYNDAPAWHFDNKGTLTPIDQQSWGQWRGHSSVSSFHGNSGPTQSVESYLYFRGMHGDRLNRTGGMKTVELTNSKGVKNLDHDMIEGQMWEQRRWNGSTTDELSSTINTFWVDKTWDGGSVDSYIVQVGQTDTRIEAKALPGQMRYTRTKTEFEPGTGLSTKAIDFGEVTSTGADVVGDETCTSTEYARNTEYYRFFAARVQTRKGSGCAGTDQLLSRTETFHDGHSGLFDVPTNGRPTAARSYVTDTEFIENKTEYDTYGRPTKMIDAEDRTRTTVYEPAGLRPITKITETNPKGWQTVTTMAPWWAQPTSMVDANGKRTDIAYDAIGRTVRVWKPDQPRAANPDAPSVEFSYGVSPYTPNWSRTRSLHQVNAGTPSYLDSWSYVDGFGGESETQVPAPGGGRIVTHKGYDDRGLLHWDSAPMHNTANAGSGILNPAANTVPSRTVMFYDTLERQTSSQLWSMATKKWETTTAHDGDRTTVTPPAGGAVTTVVDAHGRTILSRAYDGPSTSTNFRDTVTTYHPSGAVATVRDPAGNVATNSYDLLGRVTESVDPDAGKVTATYTKTGQAATATDARGKKVTSTYDELDRKAGLFDGDANGTRLASWTYDPAGAKGQPASASRHVGDRMYTSAATGYDDNYRALGTSITIPSQEGALAGTYSFGVTYDKAGRTATATYPQAGGLSAETVTATYTDLGFLRTLSGQQTYVSGTGFDQIGRLVERQYGTAPGPIRRYGYDEATSRLAFARTLKGGTNELLLERQYSYDQVGNPTQVAEFAGTTAAPSTPTLSARECFRHNAFQQLTTAWTTTGDCATEPATGQAGGVDPYHLAWDVNAIGNRTKETDKKRGQVRDYTYPAAGQPRPHAVTGIGADRFEYDAAGNTTKRVVGGIAQTFGWDGVGRLDKVTDSSKGETSYVYDTDGNRLIRRDPSGVTLYLGSTELRVPAGGQPAATRYYSHGGATVAVRTTSGLHWQLSDRQASAELSIEATTGNVTRRRYLPHGGERSSVEVWPTDRGFLDKTKDSSTGLSHLGAREYDPATGQFLSVDPLVGQTGTAYSYAANNPVTYADPSGLAYEECTSGMYACRGGTKVIKRGKNYDRLQKQYARDNEVYARNSGRAYCPSQCVRARQADERVDAIRKLARRLEQTRKGLPDLRVPHGYNRAEVESIAMNAAYQDWCASNGVIACDNRKASLSEGVHALLDLLGFIPGYGEAADAANAMLYMQEGDVTNALLSAAGAVPLAGWGATGARIAKNGAESGKALRPVGAQLESVHDVMANPSLLKGRTPAEVEAIVGSTSGWKSEKLAKGSRKGQGWVFRHYNERGNPTGIQLRWHPGGGHHGPDPYWRVVGPNGDLGGVVQ